MKKEKTTKPKDDPKCPSCTTGTGCKDVTNCPYAKEDA